MAALLWGIALGNTGGPRPPAGAPAQAAPAAIHPAMAHQPSRLPKLTAAQLAGQRVIYSYSGLAPPPRLLKWIRHGEAGGVIFFSQNIASKPQIAAVIAKLDRANASRANPLRAFPLLLMADQEGGLVRRLPGPPVLSERQIGQSAELARSAKAAGAGAGHNLASVGMNVNLAPVLDVYRARGNFDDQFARSYSMSPATVSRAGAYFIEAQQARGVAATAKHFPGLGAASTSQNTDRRPVTLNIPLHTLRTVDEYPYRAAIAARVRLIMVSWAVYPALDRTRPAGLSAIIVQAELRRRLGFRGVTITDALEAGALQHFGSIGHRAMLAARAGMDLLLCSAQQASEGQHARAALADAFRNRTLRRSAFRSALARILALRHSLSAGAHAP